MASSKLSKFVVAVDNTNINSEEAKLWTSVVSMAAYDAVKKTEYDVYAGREILEARNWFRNKGWDFHYVCNLAGMNPDYVHFKICLLYTSPSPRDGLLSRMPSSA